MMFTQHDRVVSLIEKLNVPKGSVGTIRRVLFDNTNTLVVDFIIGDTCYVRFFHPKDVQLFGEHGEIPV